MRARGRVDDEIFRAARQVLEPFVVRGQAGNRGEVFGALLETGEGGLLGVEIGQRRRVALRCEIGGEVGRDRAFAAPTLRVRHQNAAHMLSSRGDRESRSTLASLMTNVH
ncbi:hypothetical protein D3C83_24240 [compost metagenome]